MEKFLFIKTIDEHQTLIVFNWDLEENYLQRDVSSNFFLEAFEFFLTAIPQRGGVSLSLDVVESC